MSGSSRIRTIAIVGAGFSGTLCAVNLLRAAQGMLRVVLIERHSRHGRGLAYRTWDDNFVLNVPAGNMSALADDPGHFVRYCQSIDPAFNAGSFVSRRIYGDYLEYTLEESQGGRAGLERLQAEVLAVRRLKDGDFTLELADGKIVTAERVVLAFGHFAPRDPSPPSLFYRSGSYIANPWNFSALDRIAGDTPVALLGAAHTAIDVLFRLTSQRDARKVYLISRRGLVPQPHRMHPQSPAATNFPSFFENLEPTVRQYLRALRREVKQRVAQGGDWRDVLNSLRPHMAEIWQRFSLSERRRFLSTVVAYWDIHRHRLAPVAHLRLSQMLKSGQVEIVAGYVQDYDEADGKVTIRVRERGRTGTRTLTVGSVVNCTGPNYDVASIDASLLVQLRNDGYLRGDLLKLGLDADDDYRVVGADGTAVDGLFYIGPMLKARYWEAIAVPELRVHARKLAAILLVQTLVSQQK